MVIYFFLTLGYGGSIDRELLKSDTHLMQHVALHPAIIVVGFVSSTISSARSALNMGSRIPKINSSPGAQNFGPRLPARVRLAPLAACTSAPAGARLNAPETL